jgi:hypothetical protein
MQSDQGRILQSLRDVQTFLETYAGKLGDVVNTGARKSLDDMIAELANHVTDQTSSFIGAKSATQQQAALRQVLLRDHMAPIARIARASLPNTPAVAPLRMPKGAPGIEKLAAAAYGMAKAAAPFTATFTAAGLPADFVERLNQAADAMIAAVGDRSQKRGARRGATTGLKTTLSKGRKIVGVLDAFVHTALKDDPSLLSNWNGIKRVSITTGGKQTSAADAPATPASTPSTPAPASAPAPTTPKAA